MTDAKRSRPERTAVVRRGAFIPTIAFAGIVLAVGGGYPSQSGSPLPSPITLAPSQRDLDIVSRRQDAASPARVAHAAVERFQVPPSFTHADHESVQCFTCHDTGDQHGALLIDTIQDCRGCHHSAPLSATCSRCHTAADAPDESFRTVRAVSFSVGTPDPARTLEFLHEPHIAIDCARCHTEGSELAVPATLDCAGCHADHHTATSDCASCHVAAPVTAHPPAEAHVTCSGAACHQRVPFESVPRTREFCLGCHQTMREHEAPRACAECHSLPAPRSQAGGVE